MKLYKKRFKEVAGIQGLMIKAIKPVVETYVNKKINYFKKLVIKEYVNKIEDSVESFDLKKIEIDPNTFNGLAIFILKLKNKDTQKISTYTIQVNVNTDEDFQLNKK